VRVVSRAWYGGSGSAVYASPGMTQAGYSIPVSGVKNGELLIIIGTIDKGSPTVMPDPIAPGYFTLAQVAMTKLTSGLGPQMFFAAWKIAGNEPSVYTGTYGAGNVTGSATIALLAVSGAALVNPVDEWWYHWDTTNYQTTLYGTPPQATAHSDGEALIFAMGSDWSMLGGSNTSEPPPGFVPLTSFGDHGDENWDWTSMQIAWGYQPTAGPVGPFTGTMSGTRPGAPWATIFEVSP
jgi:hypothetical protein